MKHSPWKWCLNCAVSQLMLFSALLAVFWGGTGGALSRKVLEGKVLPLFFIACVLIVANGRLVNVWVRTSGGWICLSQLHPINLLINLLIASRVTGLRWIHSHCLQVVLVAAKWHTEKLLWLTVLDIWIEWRSWHIFKPFLKNNCTAWSSMCLTHFV